MSIIMFTESIVFGLLAPSSKGPTRPRIFDKPLLDAALVQPIDARLLRLSDQGKIQFGCCSVCSLSCPRVACGSAPPLHWAAVCARYFGMTRLHGENWARRRTKTKCGLKPGGGGNYNGAGIRVIAPSAKEVRTRHPRPALVPCFCLSSFRRASNLDDRTQSAESFTRSSYHFLVRPSMNEA